MFHKIKVIAPELIKISRGYYRMPYLMKKIKLEAIWQNISYPKVLLNSGHPNTFAGASSTKQSSANSTSHQHKFEVDLMQD